MAERRVKETEEPVAVPPAPVAGPWQSYKELVAQLADRIVEGQKPIRVLQALRWDDSVEEQFLRSKQRELPQIDAAYYANVDLGFDVRAKVEEFETLARDIERILGEGDAIGNVMLTTALEYRDVVRMLAARGTPAFYEWSRKLYGSPKDKFPDGRSTVRGLGQLLYGLLTNVDEWSEGGLGARPPSGVPARTHLPPEYARNLDATEAARKLGERLALFFGDTRVSVEADDGILADAAAGSDYVKVRNGAKLQRARHRHPRGARGLGARGDLAQRTGAARRQVARQGSAAHDRGAGGPRGPARDVHVPHVPAPARGD